MLAGFSIALLSGHIYILIICTGIQVVSFKEVSCFRAVELQLFSQLECRGGGPNIKDKLLTILREQVIAIAQVPTKQKNLPLTKSLNWYVTASL
jgi:phosphatidate cytidylyltransferase